MVVGINICGGICVLEQFFGIFLFGCGIWWLVGGDVANLNWTGYSVAMGIHSCKVCRGGIVRGLISLFMLLCGPIVGDSASIRGNNM